MFLLLFFFFLPLLHAQLTSTHQLKADLSIRLYICVSIYQSICLGFPCCRLILTSNSPLLLSLFFSSFSTTYVCVCLCVCVCVRRCRTGAGLQIQHSTVIGCNHRATFHRWWRPLLPGECTDYFLVQCFYGGY